MECGAPGVAGAPAARPVALGVERERDDVIIRLQPMGAKIAQVLNSSQGPATLRTVQVAYYTLRYLTGDNLL